MITTNDKVNIAPEGKGFTVFCGDTARMVRLKVLYMK